MNKQILTILLFLASFYIQAQQYNNDTLPIYTTNQYFEQCADSLGKKYQLHFVDQSGDNPYFFERTKFKDKYGNDKLDELEKKFNKCQYDLIYDFYVNDCSCKVDTSFMNLTSLGIISTWTGKIIIPDFDHSLDLVKCSFKMNGGFFDVLKKIDSALENHDTTSTTLFIEVIIHSNENKKSVIWSKILKQYFHKVLTPHLKKMKIISFKAKQNNPLLKEESNYINMRMIDKK